MRNVYITEKQYEMILEGGYPLNLTDGSDVTPDAASGAQVFTNNTDKDADPNVTTTDAKSKRMSTRRLAYLRTNRTLGESTFNDVRTNNLGKNQKKEIINAGAQEGSGKMLKNLANDINGEGTRDNTQRVRINRMEKQKIEDPVAYEKNGGDKTLKALKDSTRAESDKQKRNAEVDAQTNNIVNGQSTIPKEGHHSNIPIFYYH